MNVSVYVDYVYLTAEERDEIQQRESEYLFEQLGPNEPFRPAPLPRQQARDTMFWTNRNGRWVLVRDDEANRQRIARDADRARRERDRANDLR